MTATAWTRRPDSRFASWWWTVDRVLLATVIVLAVLGAIFLLYGSAAVSKARLGDPNAMFVRHMVFSVLALGVLFVASLMKPLGVLRFGFALFVFFAALTALTPVFGVGQDETGAARWISTPIGWIQPSEFLKPCLIVVCAQLLTTDEGMGRFAEAGGLVVLTLAVLALQPDYGMAAVVLAVFGVQLFLAGLAWRWIVTLGLMIPPIAGAAYVAAPHVRHRIDVFLDPNQSHYQLDKAYDAFIAGGWFGRGAGEGVVKLHLPDAHADFVFAATAEDFGAVACLLLIALFAFLIGRAAYKACQCVDRFSLIAAGGLVAQIGLQAFVNMGVNLELLPPKGMTLPLVSYGGSSLLAIALGLGFLLALTRDGARLERVP